MSCNKDCQNCKKSEEMKNYYLEINESVFDAVYDYQKWLENCKNKKSED